jgi:hypothetical protein
MLAGIRLDWETPPPGSMKTSNLRSTAPCQWRRLVSVERLKKQWLEFLQALSNFSRASNAFADFSTGPHHM